MKNTKDEEATRHRRIKELMKGYEFRQKEFAKCKE